MKKDRFSRRVSRIVDASVWEKEVLRISITPPFSQSPPLWSFVCYCLRVNLRVFRRRLPNGGTFCKRLVCRGLAHTRLAVRRRSLGPVTIRKSKYKSVNTSAFLVTNPTAVLPSSFLAIAFLPLLLSWNSPPPMLHARSLEPVRTSLTARAPLPSPDALQRRNS